MCNPHPGKRCLSDSKAPLKYKLAQLENMVQKRKEMTDIFSLDNDAVDSVLEADKAIKKIADDIKQKKVMLYATSGAQSDRSGTMKLVNEMQADLSYDAIKAIAGHDELENYRTGEYLNRFQNLADDARKNHDGDNQQVTVARQMFSKDFPAAKKKAEEQLRNRYDAQMAEAVEASGSDAPSYRTEEVEERYASEKRMLDTAYGYAREDARAVLVKDMDANSKRVQNKVTGVTNEYHKNIDGSFTVSSEFSIRAKNFADAHEAAENCFKLEDFELSSSQTKDGQGYDFKAKYVYKKDGAESFDDAYNFQKAVFTASSLNRSSSLDDIHRLKEHYASRFDPQLGVYITD